jgi:hypothetical protein
LAVKAQDFGTKPRKVIGLPEKVIGESEIFGESTIPIPLLLACVTSGIASLPG